MLTINDYKLCLGQVDIIFRTYQIVNQVFKFESEIELIVAPNDLVEGNEAMVTPHKTEKKYLVAINEEFIEKNNCQDELIRLIAHELTHVNQFEKGELIWTEDDAVYKGELYRYENDLEYWFAPWEVEARGMEDAFLSLYRIKEAK